MGNRINIKARFITVVTALKDAKGQQLYKSILDEEPFPTDVGKVHYPACFVYLTDEDPNLDEEEIGSEEWALQVAVEIWAESEEIEGLLEITNAALYTDTVLSLTYHFVKRGRTELAYLDMEKKNKAMTITYTIDHQTAIGGV